jgi:hypothetical protein
VRSSNRHRLKGFLGCKTTTSKGCVKITAGAGRGKYEHRWTIEKLLRDPIGLCWLPIPEAGPEIPRRYTVHHIDQKKAHNYVGNLMVLDKAIHNALHEINE